MTALRLGGDHIPGPPVGGGSGVGEVGPPGPAGAPTGSGSGGLLGTGAVGPVGGSPGDPTGGMLGTGPVGIGSGVVPPGADGDGGRAGEPGSMFGGRVKDGIDSTGGVADFDFFGTERIGRDGPCGPDAVGGATP